MSVTSENRRNCSYERHIQIIEKRNQDMQNVTLYSAINVTPVSSYTSFYQPRHIVGETFNVYLSYILQSCVHCKLVASVRYVPVVSNTTHVWRWAPRIPLEKIGEAGVQGRTSITSRLLRVLCATDGRELSCWYNITETDSTSGQIMTDNNYLVDTYLCQIAGNAHC